MKIMKGMPHDAVEENLSSTNRDEVLKELSSLIVSADDEIELDNLVTALKTREDMGSTGIGGGIAIPHGKFKDLKEVRIAFGRSMKGIDFNAVDGKPVDLFFLLLAPDNAVAEHLKTLARISRLLKEEKFCNKLREAKTKQEIIDLIAEEDKKI